MSAARRAHIIAVLTAVSVVSVCGLVAGGPALFAAGFGAAVLGASTCQAAPAVPAGSFTVLSSTSEELRFSFTGEPAGAERGEDGSLFFHDRVHPEAPSGGRFSLPVACAWIAVPPGTHPTISVRLEESEPIAWPEGATADDRRELPGLLAAEGWTSSADCWTRLQWGRSFRFCPVIPDGAGLRYVRAATVTVRFTAPLEKTGGGGADPAESLYRGRFLNYEQGKAWRRGPTAPAKAAGAAPPGTAPAGTAPVTGDYFSSTPNPWIRISIPRRGYYEIRGIDLEALGLSLNDIDITTVRVFCAPPYPLPEGKSVEQVPSWMREIPIEVEGGEDGTFGADDAVRFVGQGPDGWFADLGVPPTPQERHYIDPYNDTNFYWLTWGGQFTENPQPRRMTVSDRSQVSSTPVSRVYDQIHFEQDKLWDPRPRDIYLPAEKQAVWESFFWAGLSVNLDDVAQIFRLSPPDPVTELPARVRLRFWGNSYNRQVRPWDDHTVRATLNGALVGEKSWDGFIHMDIDSTGRWLGSGEQILRVLVPAHPPAPYQDSLRFDQVYLSWAEMDYWRDLHAAGDSISFTAGGLSGAQTLEIGGFTRNDVYLLDTTDPWSPVRLLPEVAAEGGGYRARFRTEINEENPPRLLAATAASLRHPHLDLVRAPEGGWLRERQSAVQGLVIAHGDFLPAARTLADFRSDHFPGLSHAEVAVVGVQDVMDEFAFGRTDPTALRNFLQFADSAWTGGDPAMGPSYVVLLGDAHFDFRNRLGLGARSFVPTYEGYYDSYFQAAIYSPQFASDDYYGYLDGPSDTGLDLFIGRLPAENVAQATTLVEKVVSYEDSPDLGDWRGRLTLVADDICQGAHPDVLKFAHMRQTEELVPLLPRSIQPDKIYLYEYGPECVYFRKPDAAAALENRIEDGTLLVNFTGHGSEQQLADERVLETNDVAGMTNRDRLFLFFTASCSVGKYDYFGDGLGEALILHPGGGAVAIFSASAIAYSTGNSALNISFFKALFPDSIGGPARPIGEAAVLAKAAQGGSDINSRRYILLGDPATRLAAPARKIDLRLADARTGAEDDSLIRGRLTDLRGTVLDESGRQAYGYNGTVSLRIYDSSILRRPEGANQLRYLLLGAPVYRGTADVRDGTFRVRFQAPSALATDTGGRAQIFAHAHDDLIDAQGGLRDLPVPLRSETNADREGPAISLKVEGDPGAVLPRSYFWATLKDSSGINITGLVASRSVIAQFEENGSLVTAEDISSRVVFPAGYDSGTVQASLPGDLVNGHTYDLIMRATDNMKNSATGRITFTMTGATPTAFALSGVYNFPNPADGPTGFYGILTQNAEVNVEVFSLSGRSLWSPGQPRLMTPSQFATEGIPWDGRDRAGDTLANGVYLYKVTARPEGGGAAITKVERLVVYRR